MKRLACRPPCRHAAPRGLRPVDLSAPVPVYETGIDPNAWAQVAAGEFVSGSTTRRRIDYDFEIMVTDVTVGQYVAYLNEALAEGTLRVERRATGWPLPRRRVPRGQARGGDQGRGLCLCSPG